MPPKLQGLRRVVQQALLLKLRLEQAALCRIGAGHKLDDEASESDGADVKRALEMPDMVIDESIDLVGELGRSHTVVSTTC